MAKMQKQCPKDSCEWQSNTCYSVDRTAGLDTPYTRISNRYCNSVIRTYHSQSQAQLACSQSSGCHGISDSGCDNRGFWSTCRDTGIYSARGSCLYAKYGSGGSGNSGTSSGYSYDAGVDGCPWLHFCSVENQQRWEAAADGGQAKAKASACANL